MPIPREPTNPLELKVPLPAAKPPTPQPATPLPPKPSTPVPAPPASTEDYLLRVTAIYERYAPEKLPMVATNLAKYSGREDDLIASLVHKYGPEPRRTPVPNDDGGGFLEGDDGERWGEEEEAEYEETDPGE
jgi:hypothetical protein